MMTPPLTLNRSARAHSRVHLRAHLIVLLFYLGASLVLTWPLAAHFMTHVTGDGIDDPSLVWNLWWVKARLVEQLNFDVFHADWMFFPIGINLGFYTLTPLNGLLSIPLQTAAQLVVANNVLLLSSFVFGGYGTYLLVRYLLGGWIQTDELSRELGQDSKATTRRGAIGLRCGALHIVPVFCGFIYAFAAPKLFYASLGQFNIASSQWIPFTVLYVLRATDLSNSFRWRDALLAGLFLTFQAWAELTFASFLLIFIGILFLWQVLVSDIQDIPGERLGSPLARLGGLLPRYVAIGLVFAVGLVPFLWAMVPDMLREGDFFASGGGFADIFSADLLGYFLPTRLHPLWGGWSASLLFPNDKGQQIFIGYLGPILALLGTARLLRYRRWKGLFWPLAGIFFWWLTLGPVVRLNGQETGIPGPFALIRLLPFFSGNRYPSRYGVMLLLVVSVLAGYGAHWVWSRLAGARERSDGVRIGGSVVFGLLALLFVGEQVSVPLPLNDFSVPELYQQIAAEPGDFTVLELPTGWRNGARVLGKSDVLIMMQQWYQTTHSKRRLGGNTSRNPEYKFQYFTQAPLLGDLIALMNADQWYMTPVVDSHWQSLVERNRAIAPAVLNFLNVKYVTVHVEKAPPQLLRFVEEALPVELVDEWQGPDWTGAPSTIRLYRVREAADTGWTIQLGSRAGNLNVAEGWSMLGARDGRVRYALRKSADLMLDIPQDGGAISLQVFGPAPLAELKLNKHPLSWRVVQDGGEYSVVEAQVPPGVADEPIDRLTVRFDGSLAPSGLAELPPSDAVWRVGDTGGTTPADRSILVTSAGQDVGDFGLIRVAGTQVAVNKRGYNLVAIDQAGRILDSAAFDTFLDPEESAAMAAWIDQKPPGTIVAGAVRDEASAQLGQDAVNALAKLGVTTDLRGRFRWSHAFIGVVGAPAGSAIEDASLLKPAVVWVGSPMDGPYIAGGIGLIEFSPRDSSNLHPIQN